MKPCHYPLLVALSLMAAACGGCWFEEEGDSKSDRNARMRLEAPGGKVPFISDEVVCDMLVRFNDHVAAYIEKEKLKKIDFLAIYSGGMVMVDPVFLVADGQVHYTELYRIYDGKNIYESEEYLKILRHPPVKGWRKASVTPEIAGMIDGLNPEALESEAVVFDAPLVLHVDFDGTKIRGYRLFPHGINAYFDGIRMRLIKALGKDIETKYYGAAEAR